MAANIITIKNQLEDKIGSRITLIAQSGRKKQSQRSGVLAETYPSVFVVDLDQDENAFDRVSYSYRDILTNSIEVLFTEDEDLIV
ncbi:hypothetical protein CBF34_00345 [Vagococcus penaei]|uniref:Uncharacterized protein n=1 Tax=Vagococcus penaei TaxID=633807 RepID=A0A1Q2D571_9ENTE|nr:Veg family protein [Vagococcus penaei]AQP53550.1 hypothetical protein BW732_04425 [Vagococcus penaei]RSU07493.1 hypothetical protein CBF34_00345 [Vagococcus penaei]